MDWAEVFATSIPVAELILRGTVLYLAVFTIMRLFGRRESGELNMSDLILILIISEAASIGIGGEAHSILDSLIVVLTIFTWSYLFDAAAYRWKWAEKLLKPKVQALIADGKLNLRIARKELLSRSEILSALREKGIENIEDVYRAYIEPNGAISVINQKDQ